MKLGLIKSVSLALAGTLWSAFGAATGEPSAEGVEFFEKHIRPVLADKCFTCHSAKSEKIKGALLLDSRASSLKGGATGPAVVPGDLEKSLLIKAVRYKDEKSQMPPDEPLTDQQIADFETWVRMGAPDPRSVATSVTPDLAKAKEFWSFKKPVLPAIPTLNNNDPKLMPIDKFVRAKLESKGLPTSPRADNLTLIRRATFDLIGLPPTPEEIDAFNADPSPDAFAKVIDRLLASPRYGERWGRYWLDVARYADTKGYVFQEERRYPYSYVYRDWVVNAINADVPYDQFLIKQVAADKLPPTPDNSDLAAMGFLLLGRRFLNNQADIIDDRLDVLIRGTQGLTIGCARCHDHKFDAITQKDYYGLYSVFASSTEPKDLPLVGKPEANPTSLQYDKEVKAKEVELEALRIKHHETKLAGLRSEKSIADYLMAVRELGDTPFEKLKQKDLNGFAYARWKAYVKTNVKATDPIWAPWAALSGLKDTEFAEKAPGLVAKFAANIDGKLNALMVKAFTAKAPATIREVAEKYGALIAAQVKPSTEKVPAAEAVRQIITDVKSPLNIAFADLSHLLNRADTDMERKIHNAIDALAATHPGAPPRAMVLNDGNLVTQHIFLRGNVGRPGDVAPRQFLSLLTSTNPQPFKNGSGRLELAQAIASPENPLTARVMVNRVWLHHFGSALVQTPSDFGVRSDAPINQELLDYLAINFMQNGWSLKKLHREMMLSQTYQQSSDDNQEARKIDSENTYLWRYNRQRLDFEAMRDALLAASGQLDTTMGGRSVELTAQPFPKRRSIYGYIDRQNLPGMFRAFDFASPDTHSPMRYNTTVPQQALYMMNSPFVIDLAKQLAARPEIASEHDTTAKLQKLYRATLGRPASPGEAALGAKFIELAEGEKIQALVPPPALWQYGYGFYDETKKRVTEFTAFKHFTGTTWQAGPKLPDPKIGYASLSSTGGHPGGTPHLATVRRWTAPRDGTFAVSGKLNHPAKAGDGVRARVVSSVDGGVGEFIALSNAVETKVEKVALKKGDSLDFVIDCRTGENSDGYSWTVTIRILDYGASFSDEHGAIEWTSNGGFSGPPGKPATPLAPWEKYAQVLLLSNEFDFVD
ncbi:MAG: PSD1 and planctomycete cytochrome C domain-containing protein [Planctomycetota bacterium]